MNENCIVLLTNDSYFDKMVFTLTGILQNGYTGDICIVIGDDLLGSPRLNELTGSNIHIKHFPDIKFSSEFLDIFKTLNRSSHWTQKIFQYHKLHLFNTFFKQWNFILYIDSGVHVRGPVNLILQNKKQDKLLAHSDAYPTYEWKLACQFNSEHHLFSKLQQQYNLDIDYFQTTVMLYDTSIINDDTYNQLLALVEQVKISNTNDQGIIALFFTNIMKDSWEQIPLGDDRFWYYDYLLRPTKLDKPHILIKSM